MSTEESSSGIWGIIEASQPVLEAERQAAILAQQGVADATNRLDEATNEVRIVEASLGVARKRVEAAETSLADSQLDVLASRDKIANAAHETAACIVNGPGDVKARTLFGLIYQDDSLAKDDNPAKAYADAAKRGETALVSIMNRLQPGEPVLHIGHYHAEVSLVPRTDAITATLPKITNNQTRTVVSGGSIELLLPETVSAYGDKTFVSVETTGERSVNLFGSSSTNNLKRLAEAGDNGGPIIVGSEAIVQALETAEPWGQFVAMTALKAAGVDIEFVLDEDLRTETEGKLIAFISYLATGNLPGTKKKSEATITFGQDELSIQDELMSFTIESMHEQSNPEAQLEEWGEKINVRSVRSMAQAIGLDKETTRGGVEEVLRVLAEDEGSFFDPDLNARSLDRVLETIFDS